MGDFVRALHVRFICAALSAVLATISPLGAAGVAHAATTVPTASATDREGGESAASLEASTTASVVREATELRTENSKHFVLSDGSMRAEIYSAPIHYKDESGAFVALDTRLVQEDAHGTHRTAAAGARARFRGAGVPGKPVTLQRGGLTIDIDMVGCRRRRTSRSDARPTILR